MTLLFYSYFKIKQKAKFESQAGKGTERTLEPRRHFLTLRHKGTSPADTSYLQTGRVTRSLILENGPYSSCLNPNEWRVPKDKRQKTKDLSFACSDQESQEERKHSSWRDSHDNNQKAIAELYSIQKSLSGKDPWFISRIKISGPAQKLFKFWWSQ